MNTDETKETNDMTYADRIAEARRYYALVARAAALGIPTSLDDPRSPKTIADLEAAVAARSI